jgi:hypothetical protein
MDELNYNKKNETKCMHDSVLPASHTHTNAHPTTYAHIHAVANNLTDIAEHTTFSTLEMLMLTIYILETHFIKNTITLKHHTDQMYKPNMEK